MDEKFNPEASTNLRAENESDRSAEFKTSRDALIASINEWLKTLSAARDARQPLAGDKPVKTEPRLVLIPLEASPRPHFASFVEERRTGVSLTGDNIQSPFVFQSVDTNTQPGSEEVTELKGTDPIALAVHGPGYGFDRQSEIVAHFGIRHYSVGPESYFAFTFYGDGRVVKSRLGEDGIHTSTTTRATEDIVVATAAFAQIQADFLPQK